MSEALPVYLVRGEDPVLRGEAMRALVHELVGDGDGDAGLMVEEHEGSEEGDMVAVADAAQTPPFLTDRRIVVVREVHTYPSAAVEPLLAYLEDPLPSSTVVLAGGKGISQKLVNAVKKVGHVVEAGVPANKKGRDVWLAEQLRGAPVKLDPGAAKLVDAHLGEDLGRLTNLLESLAAAYGHGARIGVDDVEPFLGEAGSVPPWELTDAVDRGDTAGALSTLHRMLHAGDRHPLVVMATLHNHYARMLRLDGAGVRDEAQAAEALGMKGSTFPAKKALTQSRRLGHDGVAEAFRLLAEADLDLRKLRKDWPEELVMEVLVARLSRLGGRSR